MRLFEDVENNSHDIIIVGFEKCLCTFSQCWKSTQTSFLDKRYSM